MIVATLPSKAAPFTRFEIYREFRRITTKKKIYYNPQESAWFKRTRTTVEHFGVICTIKGYLVDPSTQTLVLDYDIAQEACKLVAKTDRRERFLDEASPDDTTSGEETAITEISPASSTTPLVLTSWWEVFYHDRLTNAVNLLGNSAVQLNVFNTVFLSRVDMTVGGILYDEKTETFRPKMLEQLWLAEKSYFVDSYICTILPDQPQPDFAALPFLFGTEFLEKWKILPSSNFATLRQVDPPSPPVEEPPSVPDNPDPVSSSEADTPASESETLATDWQLVEAEVEQIRPKDYEIVGAGLAPRTTDVNYQPATTTPYEHPTVTFPPANPSVIDLPIKFPRFPWLPSPPVMRFPCLPSSPVKGCQCKLCRPVGYLTGMDHVFVDNFGPPSQLKYPGPISIN